MLHKTRSLPALFSMVLCLAFQPFLVPGARSQMVTKTDSFTLEPIIVTATRNEQLQDETTANVVIITQDQIRDLPVHNLAEALNHVPGLFMDISGGLGSQATPSIQGSFDRQVAVYLDGVPLNMMANPTVDLSQLPLDNIDRIEIHKGAASSVWGSSLGGVINIITQQPSAQKLNGSVDALYGQNQTFRVGGLISGTINRLGYFVSASHLETDGDIDHAEYDLDQFYTKFRYPIYPTGYLTFSLGYIDGLSQNPLPTIIDFFDQSDRRRFFQTLSLHSAPWASFKLELSIRNQRFVNRQDRLFTQLHTVENNFELVERLFGASIKGIWETGERNTLVAGADGDWGSYSFSVLEQNDLSSRNTAAFVNDTFTTGPWTFTAGLRLDDNKDFGSELSPSAGAVYRFSFLGAVTRFNVSRGYSAPPLNYLFYPEIGNPDLTPETGISYQLGGSIRPWRFLNFSINLFLAQIDDLINYDSEQDKLVNVDEVTRKGLEASLQLTLPYGFETFLGCTYVKLKDENTGQEITDTPGLIWDLIFKHRYSDLVQQSLIGKYIWYNSSLEETRDNKFLFDYLIRVKVPETMIHENISLFAAVHNLFNSTRYYRRVFPSPSRWIEAGIRLDF